MGTVRNPAHSAIDLRTGRRCPDSPAVPFSSTTELSPGRKTERMVVVRKFGESLFSAFALVRCCMLTPGQAKSARELVWIEEQWLAGWGCSECAWVFNASGWPLGNTLEDVTRNFQMQLSEEFASHDCSGHPRTKAAAAAGDARPAVRQKSAHRLRPQSL
jgi:hypothetical protein